MPICRERITSVDPRDNPPTCILANRTRLRVSRFLAARLAVGDEIAFPIPAENAAGGTEIYVTKHSLSERDRHCYQGPIGYVTQPRPDKRGHLFVAAEVQQPGLGITSVFLPCDVLRDYFFPVPLSDDKAGRPTLYDILRIPQNASPAELRVAYKLRSLELAASGAVRREQVALERAFNILAQPELRACYDGLLADPEAPAVFPYGGFGSLLVEGTPSRDGYTFFARRILGFLPDRRQRRFHIPLRKCDFYDDLAVCRDVRRKVEFWLDPAVLHTIWDSTWNQWKHLSGAKLEVDATFVQSGKYRKRRGEWELVEWETALPSRLRVTLPGDFDQQVEAARRTYHRFGQFSRALDQVRSALEHRAIEKAELEKICSDLRIPGDFDIAQISWRPDYDPFFYRQLARRSRKIYLFRAEYIFGLEKAVVVEKPELGHATYVFAKPRSMESFLALYTKISKDDIRNNRDNAGEKLGFLGRVIHGSNPRVWLQELRQRVGERVDFAASTA